MNVKLETFPKKEYKTWQNIQWRCHCKTARDYHKYGARGIKVHRGWRRSFKSFFLSVGMAPSKSHSLDRIDNNRGYEPGNVKWASALEQTRNRRNTLKVLWDGKYVPVAHVCELYGLPYSTVQRRLMKGWSAYNAIYTPIKQRQSDRHTLKHHRVCSSSIRSSDTSDSSDMCNDGGT